MVQKKKRLTKTQRLLNAWVMRLAHHMSDEYGMGMGKALKLAYMAAAVLNRLGKGEAEFVFLKDDGSLRSARGTLHRGIDPDFDNYESKGNGKRRDNSNTEGIYTYWDLERHAFRTFKAINLIDVKCKKIDEGLI